MSVASLFLRTAVLIGIAGIVLGIFMGINQDFRLAHMHAHLNLLGWVSLFLFGGFYHVVPGAAAGRLAKVHYFLQVIGLAVFMTGLVGIALDWQMDMVPFAAGGSLLVLAGFLTFGWIGFRTPLSRTA
jgi:hypothetical protein